ncbi:LemA family protein [Streptosporangium canum]|uniref:LemA family protein n=1 Tax=Streptosporangium canum TaxID=324952 RepID=UPI0036B037DE
MVTQAVLVFLALVLVLLLVLLIVSTYNGLVRKRGAVDSAWAQVDVQLKHRHELVQDLVETVRGYAAHERQALEAVLATRSRAVGAQTRAERAVAETTLSGALRDLFEVAGSHPGLRADQNFAELREELAAAENRIASSRRHHDDAVLIYNNVIQMAPANIVAGVTGFARREYFRAPDEEGGRVRARSRR